MEIGSTQPSSMVSDFKPEHDVISDSYEMKWTSSIDDQDVYSALEKEFYPFKRVCFFSFDNLNSKYKSNGINLIKFDTYNTILK